MKFLLIFISLTAMAEFKPELNQIIEYEISQMEENLVESKILDEERNILTSFSIMSDLSVGVAFPFVVSLQVRPILYMKWVRRPN